MKKFPFLLLVLLAISITGKSNVSTRLVARTIAVRPLVPGMAGRGHWHWNRRLQQWVWVTPFRYSPMVIRTF